MQSKAIMKQDWAVFWSAPAKLRSSCKIDDKYFPFDNQNWFTKFDSWTYSGLKKDSINKELKKELEVSLISHFGISRITLQLYHTKIKILV
jgi:hypothetical protein